MSLFDRMTEPVFLKESSAAKEQLAQLQALLPDCPAAIKMQVEQDIRNLNAGIYGEDQIAFELKNSHIPMYIIHDMFLEYNGLTAQIDYYIITRQCNIVLECKNLIGDIEITNKGDFIRTTNYGGKKKREGIYSPITQNERHLALIKQIRSDSQSNFLSRMILEQAFNENQHSIVVLANAKTVLHDQYAKKEIKEKVIHVDQLIAYIKAASTGSMITSRSDSELRETAELYLALCKENPNDYVEKYRQLIAKSKSAVPSPVAAIEPLVSSVAAASSEPSPAEATPAAAEAGMRCPKCGAPMIKRKAARGDHAGNEFWGCSKYPKCRGIVNLK